MSKPGGKQDETILQAPGVGKCLWEYILRADTSYHSFMERVHGVDDMTGASKSHIANRKIFVEIFSMVPKDEKVWWPVFTCFFLELICAEVHENCSRWPLKAALRFWLEFLRNIQKLIQNYSKEIFTDNGEQGDSGGSCRTLKFAFLNSSETLM